MKKWFSLSSWKKDFQWISSDLTSKFRRKNHENLLSMSIVFMLLNAYTLAAHAQISDIQTTAKMLSSQTQSLNENVLELGLQAYLNARQQGLASRELLTIIDYSKPSTENRFWVVDLKNNRVLFETLVAHGKNSGNNWATHFSNQPESLASSFGVFLTGNTYLGHHGYSLKLKGLEPGVNDKAQARAIVLHAATYVNQMIARQFGRLGRSWGCPALNPSITKPVIDTIKGGTLIFAYYPDRRWLSHSSFLHHTRIR